MENNTTSNQSDNAGKNQQKQSNKQSGAEGILTLLQPHDMSKTVESAMHVFQGHHEKLPDLLQDVGNILVKASKRLTTTQLIMAAGAVTVGAVLLAHYSSQSDAFDFEAS
jgi:hypothetical protein